MAILRSLLHMAWMLVTVIPVAMVLLGAAALQFNGKRLYRIAVFWLGLAISGARYILGIRYVVEGRDNLPAAGQPVVLLVKHQSTYETFLMPVIMPSDLALDMVHIDRQLKSQAFNRVVQQGRELLARGIWVIMFPDGTRIARGQAGKYKSGGARLAIETGVPVVPVAVNSAVCWPRKAFIKYPGTVTVSIGPMISSQGRQADELMADVQHWIENEMHRIDPMAYVTNVNNP